MAMSDPVADMLTRIRNAGKAKFNSVDIPASKIKIELAKVFKAEGYIRNYKFIKDDKQGILRIYLKYGSQRETAIYELNRISKPGRRVYVKSKEVPSVYNNTGIAVLSTSRGIMTDRQAKTQNIGGELLCTIW